MLFAVLWYNTWRLTDFHLKASLDLERKYALGLNADECVEFVSLALIPPD